MTRREPLRRGAVSARLPVPDHIPRPPYVGADAIPDVSPDRQVHDGESIMRMLDACELAARVLQYAGTLVKVSSEHFLQIRLLHLLWGNFCSVCDVMSSTFLRSRL